ncbi:hypothetical protein D9V32_03440 [Mycetocola tolaasinivorans]|uniref:Gram-positive cocci surface proteins LPxTG domain-containing protein n=1 Tax=Mycetocola tolaasinivorans TaxID=76635 RepID=A0A3L7ACH8_9MICO|nr:hypothetical protein [Mycetocola tolaasinivorans]RLP77510.1 hypothetical protein D9V32_03440 [Mycetocola tolaasinivorans]
MKSIPARLGVAALGLTLVASALALPGIPAEAVPGTPPDPGTLSSVPTLDELADQSPTQQRWLSVPQSRVVLNPYNFDGSGSELEQNSGADLPLSTGFYAHDTAVRADRLMQTFLKPGPDAQPDPGTDPEPEVPVGYRADFGDVTAPNGAWTLKRLTAEARPGGAVALTTSASGDYWGSLEQRITLDLREQATLSVTVPETSGKWALKVAAPGGDDIKLHADDITETGAKTFDLTATTGWRGVTTFTLKLFAVGAAGAPATTVFGAAEIATQAGSTPGQPTGLTDEFTAESVTAWSHNSAGTTLTPAAAGGATLTLPGSEWGYRARAVSLNVTENPILTLRVAAGSGAWALKVNRSLTGNDITLQPDSTASGELSYDLAGVTGWSGNTDFYIKLFQVGRGTAGTHTTVEKLQIHPGSALLKTARSANPSWNPTELGYAARYSGFSGEVRTLDRFDSGNIDAFTRTVTGSIPGAQPVVAGALSGTGNYDATRRVLSVEGRDASLAIAFPARAEVRFYESESALRFGRQGTETPDAGSQYWGATLPDSGSHTIGASWAIRDAQHPAAEVASAAALAAISGDAPARAHTHWSDFWNDYLARVPMVGNFGIERVATGGITPEQVRHFYLQAWAGLEMNVLPATPETGNYFAQLGTGKPSMWMNGTPGTRNVASWDSLLGMQQLVQTDPENAWASFQGMMALINDQVDPDAYEYGELGGESLPSRKAQTAWILYQATGDRQKLESIYQALKLHLAWEKNNMRWVLHGHNYLDERDSEFVASLIFDLRFAAQIATELGHAEDAATWNAWRPELTRNYEEWFFPTTADKNGKTWATVQKVYLDPTRSAPPQADQGEGGPYRNEHGQWVDPGWSFYTTTALVMEDLAPEYRAGVRERFEDDYSEHRQLAGLGKFAIKAPDAQLMVYGLLDGGRAAEADEAEVIIHSLTRDMTSSGLFAEVYYETGAIGKPVGARGVRPSLFGISNLIDNVFLANGVRTDLGTPSFVRLGHSTGGVSGVSWMGKRFDAVITGENIGVSGPAVADPSICPVIPAPTGKTVGLAACTGTPVLPQITIRGERVVPGSRISVSGTGFAAGATLTLTLHSDPVELGTVPASGTGTFETEVLIPTDTPAGDHTLVVSDGTGEARAALVVGESPGPTASPSTGTSEGPTSSPHPSSSTSTGPTAGPSPTGTAGPTASANPTASATPTSSASPGTGGPSASVTSAPEVSPGTGTPTQPAPGNGPGDGLAHTGASPLVVGGVAILMLLLGLGVLRRRRSI